MIDPETTNGTPGVAHVTFGVLRSPRESDGVEVIQQANGGALVVARGKMDGWSLWKSPVFPVKADTVLRQSRYALSREGLFDAP